MHIIRDLDENIRYSVTVFGQEFLKDLNTQQTGV